MCVSVLRRSSTARGEAGRGQSLARQRLRVMLHRRFQQTGFPLSKGNFRPELRGHGEQWRRRIHKVPEFHAGGLGHLSWPRIPGFSQGARTSTTMLNGCSSFGSCGYRSTCRLRPRAALKVEGSAFQKVAQILADKLRSEEGVGLLVEALGGLGARQPKKTAT